MVGVVRPHGLTALVVLFGTARGLVSSGRPTTARSSTTSPHSGGRGLWSECSGHHHERALYSRSQEQSGTLCFFSERARVILRAEPLEEEEEDDSEVSPQKMEEWRQFRAKLMQEGLPTTVTARTPRAPPSDSPVASEFEVVTSSSFQGEVKCDPANLEVVKAQSAALGEELTQSWAHEIGVPEVGGLLLRLPLELQLVVASQSYWGKKLRDFAEKEASRERQDRPSMLLEDAADEPPAGEGYLSDVLLYRVAGRFLKQELERIARKGSVDSSGRLVVDPRNLADTEKALLDMRQQYLESWQEVVLVVEHDPGVGCRGVVLNRPAALRSNRRISAALTAALARDEGQLSSSSSNPSPAVDAGAFDAAFGQRLAAYVGCPDRSKMPQHKDQAILLHGVSDLEGATELAPGLGIFRGGLQAAVDRVADRRADALDFRFFLGSYQWGPGQVEEAIASGLYQPVACSRAIALKQCIGLPKPMWHEVSDMLGGTMKEISRLEFLKRSSDD